MSAELLRKSTMDPLYQARKEETSGLFALCVNSIAVSYTHLDVYKRQILLKPITRSYIKSLRGKYKHLPLMETLNEMKREEKDR